MPSSAISGHCMLSETNHFKIHVKKTKAIYSLTARASLYQVDLENAQRRLNILFSGNPNLLVFSLGFISLISHFSVSNVSRRNTQTKTNLEGPFRSLLRSICLLRFSSLKSGGQTLHKMCVGTSPMWDGRGEVSSYSALTCLLTLEFPC